MDQIDVGNTVRLKSGGPLMTVKKIGEYPPMKVGVCCVWFDGNQKCEEVFDPASLVPDDGGIHVESM